MFDWNNSYSVQIGSIDAQHQTLFRIAGELHTAMANGQGKTAVAKTLDRLIQYVGMHFSHEERLMRLHGYPDFPAHKAEHDALTRQVVQFQQEFQAGRAILTVQLLRFLKEWLQNHIQGSDQKYAPFLREKAVA